MHAAESQLIRSTFSNARRAQLPSYFTDRSHSASPIFDLTLPNCNYIPAKVPEFCADAAIARAVLVEFLFPPVATVPWNA